MVIHRRGDGTPHRENIQQQFLCTERFRVLCVMVAVIVTARRMMRTPVMMATGGVVAMVTVVAACAATATAAAVMVVMVVPMGQMIDIRVMATTNTSVCRRCHVGDTFFNAPTSQFTRGRRRSVVERQIVQRAAGGCGERGRHRIVGRLRGQIQTLGLFQ